MTIFKNDLCNSFVIQKHWMAVVLLTAIGINTPMVSFAQSSVTESTSNVTKQHYNITEKPLLDALIQLGREAGLQVSVEDELMTGKQSSAILGQMTVQQAVSELLAGTGLGFRVNGDMLTVVEAGNGVMTLDPVQVGGQAEQTSVGPVEGYVATRSITGTKTDTPLLEIPQSISAIPRDQLAIRNVQTDSQVLLYVPGVWAQPFGGEQNQNNPFFYIRGFSSAFGGSHVDGLVSPVNYRYEPFGVEQVDVFRGPTSTLYGQSDPGGMVNRTTKRPTAEYQGEVQVQAGTFDRKQVAGDISGPVDEGGSVLYRLTGLVRDADAPFSYEHGVSEPDKRQFVAPSLSIKPTENTSFTLLTSFLKDEIDAASTFTDSAGELTRINVEQPGFGVYDYEQLLAGYIFEHRFNEHLELRQNLRWSKMDLTTLGLYPGAIDDVARTVGRESFGFAEKRNDFVVDTHLEGVFETSGVSHTLLIGVDYQDLDDEIEFSFGVAPDLNFESPNYNLDIPPADPFIQEGIYNKNKGIYLQEQAKIDDHWIVTLGGRQDWVEVGVDDKLYGGNTKQKNKKFTYRAGLTYVIDNGVAPYASYATSFFPAGGVDINGNVFEPTVGEQIEVGLKYRPVNVNAFFSASLYELTRQNVQTPDPNNANFSVQTGEVRSRGLELEGTLDLENGFSATASYTFNDVEVTKDNLNIFGISKEGKRTTLTPENLVSVWADYTFRDGSLSGLLLGGGVRYVGSSFVDAQNTLENESYTLFDAVIHYDLSHFNESFKGASLAINASNLFDKEYITCYTIFDCQWGGERTIIATLTRKW